MAKGVGLRLLSRRGSWVQIPPSAPTILNDCRGPPGDAYLLLILLSAFLRDLCALKLGPIQNHKKAPMIPLTQ